VVVHTILPLHNQVHTGTNGVARDGLLHHGLGEQVPVDWQVVPSPWLAHAAATLFNKLGQSRAEPVCMITRARFAIISTMRISAKADHLEIVRT
jgi:hypothetical protein